MNVMTDINAFYQTRLGAQVCKTLLGAIKSAGIKTGADVRTLLIGAPDAYAAAIADMVQGPVTIAYNETETPRAETVTLSHNTLPLTDFMFDQVVMIHALEFSPAPMRLMREVQRVLTSDGQVIAIATNRLGMWSWFAATPFGEGITISPSQMREVLRDAELSPLRVYSALFAPPMDFARVAWLADMLENIGQYLRLGIGGVVVASAFKQRYAGILQKDKSPIEVKSGLQWASARTRHETLKHDKI